MSATIAEVRRSILLTLYKHETGERRHASGHQYLDPRALGPFVLKPVDDQFFQRVLRMMWDEGSVETLGDIWIFRISDKGIREAEQLVHGSPQTPSTAHASASLPGKMSSIRSIDWGKWGSIASIIAIPVALILWWFS